MFSGLMDIYRHPADRRKWLTIASGVFIIWREHRAEL